MRFEDFYTLVSRNLQQMLITANDNPVSTGYSAGKKFVIIRVIAHGFGKVLNLMRWSTEKDSGNEDIRIKDDLHLRPRTFLIAA